MDTEKQFARSLVFVAVLLLTRHWAFAAEPSTAQPTPVQQQGDTDEELDEIVVDGRRAVRKPQAILDWMARLVGQFTIDGKVDLHGHGEAGPLDLQGRSSCVGFGPGPAVQCELNVRWPDARGKAGEKVIGGVSNLDPAMMVFGFEPNRIGIRHMMVGNDGIAEGSMGYLLSGDTLVTRARCGGVSGACERVFSVTVEPDAQTVQMNIEIQVDQRRAATIAFVMRRVAGRTTQVRADPVAGRAAQLDRIDSWLRGLVGQFRLSVAGTSLDGTADCAGIGSGPGVHCMFSFGAPGQNRPGMAMLFGIDNSDSKVPRVHRLQLNDDSTAEMAMARLGGNTVTFQIGDCPVIQHYPAAINGGIITTYDVLFCKRETRVLVEPDARYVRIRQSTIERVLVCRRPTDKPCKIQEFPTPLNLDLERVQVQRFSPVDQPSTGGELDQVLLADREPLANRDDIALWLRRLVGRFRIEGTLERSLDRLPVLGMVDCVNVDRGPGLNCAIRLEAPNIDTHLNPGAFILGMDPEAPMVRYTSVDDTGVGVGATGSLWGDTAAFRTPCKSSSARTCTTTTRISAPPGSDNLRLQIDINMDGKVTASYDIQQVRVGPK